MTTTIIGQVVTADGMAQQTYLHQPDLEQVAPLTYRKPPAQLRTRSYALNAAAMRRTQPSFIAIDLDHTNDIGHVDHLELRHDGLWMVGTVHADLPRDQPLYLSPKSTQLRDGTDLILDAVAITATPAQILMQPIIVLDGELRHRSRNGWRVADRHDPMLQRAHDTIKQRNYGNAIEVVDTTATSPGIHPDDERPTGRLRYGQRGRVIEVR